MLQFINVKELTEIEIQYAEFTLRIDDGKKDLESKRSIVR